MSLDSVAGGGGLPSDLAAIIAHELATLAADAHTLQAQLKTGDIVAAVVLPSNGLTDLLEIGGLRVAAELPPTLLPGDKITVEVSGFAGDRINLHILPGAARSDHAQGPNVTPSSGAKPTVGSAAPGTAATAVKVFPNVAAASQPAATPNGRFAAGGRNLSPPPNALPLVPRNPRTAAEGLASIEARLATARATTIPSAPPKAPPKTPPGGAAPHTKPGAPRNPALGVPARNLPPVTPLRNPAPGAPVRGPLPGAQSSALPVAPRPIIAPRDPLAAALAAPIRAGPAAAVNTAAAAAAPSAHAPLPAARNPAAYAEPAALLRALRLPVTPSNVAAAQLAINAPEKLPHALETLERALTSNVDPHVATLRTLVAFLTRLDPRSPVLATQVATFVNQVVTGREVKLVQLLDAHAQAAATPAATPAAATGEPGSLAAERVAIRQAALHYDLKTQLFAALDDADAPGPSAGPKSPELTAAVGRALTAVTALQIGAAATLAANPDGFTFTLPIALPTGFARAQVRVERDAPQAKNGSLDGDNFHIAFVLETQSLGTVAIDLVTVGRAVSVGVQTEAALAQRVFSGALAGLTQRLEALRYSVAKADASVAPRGLAPALEPVAAAQPVDRMRLVDLDA